MASLDEIARHQTSLTPDDIAWLHLLAADWQIIADLSFADLVLWVRDSEAQGFWAVAQIRPTTGPTSLHDDIVGDFLPGRPDSALDLASTSGRLIQEDEPEITDDVPVRVEAIPVRRGAHVIAVVARRTNLLGLRTPSRLESAYLEASAELAAMICDGSFPLAGDRSELADSLRVGDGFIRTNDVGAVVYASPNAMSAYRRLGFEADLVGADLEQVTASVVRPSGRPVDTAVTSIVAGRAMQEAELENDRASLILRAFPLRANGKPLGTVILLRDVTELRLRERQLVSKEATIREIHHRVKNNLQTVAALLRLQGRRMDIPEARAALDEAVRRVGSIALVHETLSQSFDEMVEFDEIADRLLATVLEVSSAGRPIAYERAGTFGLISGDVATPLSMVLTELIQNAAEHAFGEGGGQITVAVNRIRGLLRMRVSDNGVGLPDGFDPASSLGLSIVSTLVESELGGTLEFMANPRARGTAVEISLTLS
ncbi:PAS domain-containing sensor histidine kinase [soil metagenome]